MNDKILVFANYFLPGELAGGPIRSLEGIIKKLSNVYDFHVITSSHDAFTKDNYSNIELNKWSDLSFCKCFYITDQNVSLVNTYKLINKNKNNFKIIYINSFFSLWFSVIPILINKFFSSSSKKIVLAPRGEFNTNALSNKKIRKFIYITLSKTLGIYKSILWHASTIHEKKDIINIFPTAIIKIVENISLVEHKKNNSLKIKDKDSINILFLSRITRMKNITGAIKILKKFDKQINFNIYGPKEDMQYYDEVISLIKSVPSNLTVAMNGPISHNKINDIFNKNHILFLPTFGENYGHVIKESFLNNCPAVISNKTPWKDLESKNIGFDCTLETDDELISKINFFLEMNQDEYNSYINKMHKNVSMLFNDSQIILDNINLFK